MKTVLVVEDMAIFREPIAAALELHGYRVISAANGRAALRMLSHECPDVVLLDLAMPQMDGIDFLRHFRGIPACTQVPVILLTAKAARDDVLTVRDLGVHDYLLKSAFSIDDLLLRLEAAVGSQAKTTASGQDRPGGLRPSLSSDRKFAARTFESLPPIVTRAELEKFLATFRELKALSPVVAEVTAMTEREDADLAEITKVIARDHAITTRILRLSGSTAHSQGRVTEDLGQAVVRIGSRRIHQAVLTMGVVDRFGHWEFQQALDPTRFWQHTIASGVVAMELERLRGARDPDRMFTTCLLHDAGQLVLMAWLGERYAEVMRVAEELAMPLDVVEAKLIGINHAEFMARILRSWRMPDAVVDPIAYHHAAIAEIRANTYATGRDVLTLWLADRLAQGLLFAEAGEPTIHPTGRVCAALRIPPDVMRELQHTVPARAFEVASAMLPSMDEARWRETESSMRGMLPPEFRPLFVSAEPGTDIYRIMCERLTIEGGPPNVGVIHLRADYDTDPLTDAYREAERTAGANRLPLVVLSPTGELRMADLLMYGRRAALLPTPLYFARFASAVGELLARAADAA